MSIVYFSLIVNILVAGFWGIALFRNWLPDLSRPFGIDTVARRILASLYLAIAVVSVVALVYQSLLLSIVLVLFPLQIIYKLLSVVAVQNIKNPIVISNVFIAVLHMMSLYVVL